MGEAGPPDLTITVEQFRDFVCTKAYDVISENRYRKYLQRSKVSCFP